MPRASPTGPANASRSRDLVLAGPARTQVLLLGVSDVLGAGLTAILGDRADVEVATTTDPPDAVLTDIDVVIVDVVGAARGGTPVPARLVRRFPALAVLALLPDDQPDLERRARARGAHGMVSTRWPAPTVVATVLAATEGRFVRPSGPASAAPQLAEPALDFTPRELEVVQHVAAGLSNSEIAAELYVSINTVKTYIRSAYRRIGCTTRSQAIVWCFEHGFPAVATSAAAD